mmetsp:Transcript_36661/g.91850  ORF Transcript_36661/g.91850 Transcript_36661/m.91850 type:complete len:103 (+) Transcript_36661:185-493(+)
MLSVQAREREGGAQCPLREAFGGLSGCVAYSGRESDRERELAIATFASIARRWTNVWIIYGIQLAVSASHPIPGCFVACCMCVVCGVAGYCGRDMCACAYYA